MEVLNRNELLKEIAETQKSINFLKQSPRIKNETLKEVSSNLKKIEVILTTALTAE